MGNKKEDALALIQELLGLNESLLNQYESLGAGSKLWIVAERLEELRDLVMDLDVCQCEN